MTGGQCPNHIGIMVNLTWILTSSLRSGEEHSIRRGRAINTTKYISIMVHHVDRYDEDYQSDVKLYSCQWLSAKQITDNCIRQFCYKRKLKYCRLIYIGDC
jgi:hypothetical protein